MRLKKLKIFATLLCVFFLHICNNAFSANITGDNEITSDSTTQQKFNAALTNHTHLGNKGYPTSPSFSAVGAGITDSISKVAMVKTSLIANKTNLATMKFNFLNLAGEKYINSRHNNTN